MAFQPSLIQGASRGGASGAIDYRLARRNLIAQVRKGRIAQHEVCDAHPELIRAATHVGKPLSDPCPICDDGDLVMVRYAFGPRLPKHGRCITDGGELSRLVRKVSHLTCYVVEVCRDCHWNHLAQSFVVGEPEPR